MTAQPRLLGGRYEIGGMIGYGGMAEVHRGRDLRLGRDVAIKMLRTDLARDETFLTRFRREAQNAASLNHPSIVAVYDTGEDTSTGTPVPYIVMEYVEGRTLKEVLTTEGRLSARRACEILADTCAALDFSHRHQIIHRDVKPGNVMLSSNGQVKVMDFGIARAMASGQATMTQTSAVIGTAQYLSPEQARGETVDARSDVYASGCLLYELLCGDPPFTGDNPVSVAYQHVREAPTPPSHLNPDIPPAVDAIVLHSLAKSASNRYQTAGEMREDLERAIAGRPVMASPTMVDDTSTQLLGAPEPDATQVVPATHAAPKKKHTGRNVLLVCLALLLVAGLGAATYFLTSPDATEDAIKMPEVVGDTQISAEDKLEKLGLKVKVEEEHSDEVDLGRVISQDPDEGTELEDDEEVTLTVSLGQDSVKVPDLSDIIGCDKMKQEVEDQNLELRCDEVSDSQSAGSLLEQDPKPGESVEVGETVVVQVSKGDMSTAPNVVSMSEQQACESIEQEKFQCEVEYVAPESGDDSPGTVISQSPGPDGDALSEGDTVTISVVGVEIPDLVGMTVEQAQQQYGDDFDIVVAGDAQGDWEIIKQDPKAGPGDYVKPGTKIEVEGEEPPPGLP